MIASVKLQFIYFWPSVHCPIASIHKQYTICVSLKVKHISAASYYGELFACLLLTFIHSFIKDDKLLINYRRFDCERDRNVNNIAKFQNVIFFTQIKSLKPMKASKSQPIEHFISNYVDLKTKIL